MVGVSLVRAAENPTGGWRFHLGSFPVHVPWNALLGVAIIALLWFPEFGALRSPVGQLGMAAVFAVLLMGSVLLHELAHAAAARTFGYPVAGITLWAMGGFTTFRTPRTHGPGREAAIAAAGPAATLAVAAVAWVASRAVGSGVTHDLLVALTSANVLVGVFNLLPGSPLDGGAIVKSAVWALTGSAETGQRVAGWVGRILAVAVAVSPFLLAATSRSQPSLPLVAVGLMLGFLLWSGASAALRTADSGAELRAIPATALTRPLAVLPAGATVADALELAVGDHLVLVQGDDGLPQGVLSLPAAEAVPGPQRATTPALTACATVGRPPEVPADADAWTVLEACRDSGSRFVAVVDRTDPDHPALLGLIDTDEAFVTEGP